MRGLLEWLFGPDGRVAVAGAMGGLVRWLTLKSSWVDGMVSIIVGAICAVYLGPLALPLVEATLGKIVLEDASRAAFSGFIIGLGGIALASFVMDVLSARFRSKKQEGGGNGG